MSEKMVWEMSRTTNKILILIKMLTIFLWPKAFSLYLTLLEN